MSLLDKLERRFRNYTIPHLTLVLVAGQTICYIAGRINPRIISLLELDRVQVIESGEILRLFTFVFVPPDINPIFVFFALYLFYLMGTALEAQWGTFRYNVYLLIAYLGMLFSVIALGGRSGGIFLNTSVFLAFAYLFPDFELLLMFILPVKVKYLAAITWVIYGWQMIVGPWVLRLLVLSSVANFFLFFGRDIWRRVQSGRRRMVFDAKRAATQRNAFHNCHVCGVTEKSDPTMEFRCCLQCDGGLEYCAVHIHDHEHV